MQMRIYNGEFFTRTKIWYILFTCIFFGIILLSLWKQNFVGVIFLFLILGAYLYFSLLRRQIVHMHIKDSYLLIQNRTYPRNSLQGYVLEIHAKTQEIKNIVLVGPKTHFVFTIHDTMDNIQTFVQELDTHIPLLPNYHQTSMDKLARLLQL